MLLVYDGLNNIKWNEFACLIFNITINKNLYYFDFMLKDSVKFVKIV